MAIEETRHVGWRVVTSDQMPALPAIGSMHDVALGFLDELRPDLSLAYKLTSAQARIPQTDNMFVHISEWLVHASAQNGEATGIPFPGRENVYTRQEKELRVPQEMEGTYRFHVARYTLQNGKKGYVMFGYQLEDDGTQRLLMAERIERASDGEPWEKAYLDKYEDPGTMFRHLASNWGRQLQHFAITIREGDYEYHPDDGVRVRLAA